MTRPIRLPDGVAAPQIETVLGVLWWIAGALALSGGAGTALMAVGLGATGVLWTVVRGRQGRGAPLGPARRARLIRQGVVAGVLALAALIGLGMVSWGEVAVPVASALVAVALFPVAQIVGSRSFVTVASGLLVLSAVGALVALGTVGATAPQGIVGFGGAVLLWFAGALRTGVLGGPTVRVAGRWLRERIGAVRTPRERREERQSVAPTTFTPTAAPPPRGPAAGRAAAEPPGAGQPVAQRPPGPVPAARPAPPARPHQPVGAGRGPAARAADPFGPTVRTRADAPPRPTGEAATEPVRRPGPRA